MHGTANMATILLGQLSHAISQKHRQTADNIHGEFQPFERYHIVYNYGFWFVIDISKNLKVI